MNRNLYLQCLTNIVMYRSLWMSEGPHSHEIQHGCKRRTNLDILPRYFMTNSLGTPQQITGVCITSTAGISYTFSTLRATAMGGTALWTRVDDAPSTHGSRKTSWPSNLSRSPVNLETAAAAFKVS